MRIRGIEIDNFLSFRKFIWTDVDRDVNIIVGPNGAGKTNLFQAIKAVLDGISDGQNAHRRRELLPQALHRGDTTRPLRIALGVEFNTTWEKDLLGTFLGAALSEEDGTDMPPDVAEEIADFWFEHLPDLDLSFLLTGQLVLTYDPFGSWSLVYESTNATFPFRWDLGPTDNGFSATSSQNIWQGPFFALLGAYNGEQAAQVQHLTLGLRQRLELPPPNMQHVLNARTIRLMVRKYHASSRRIHREFVHLAGLTPPYDTSTYTPRFVFQQLLQRALIFTENVRRVPEYTVTPQDLTGPAVDFSSGEQVPLYLFQKSTRSIDHEQYQAIRKTFHQLTETWFDVSIAPSSGNRSSVPEDKMLLEVSIDARWGKLPLAFGGAGRMEALFLSALLASSAGKVVLLDEPAQNLHPNIQTRLVNQVRSNSANQFFITTHSAVLISPDAIDKVSRFHAPDGTTRRAALEMRQLNEEDRARLQKELRGSMDARALLFARGVILVEGDTEFGTLPVWYHELFGRHLENDDFAIYSVGSDTHFEPYVHFLESYAVPWAIVCDGAIIGVPGIHDRQRCRIADQLRRAGVNNIPALHQLPFQDRRTQLEQYGVFTVAGSAERGKESFEASIPVLGDAIDAKSKARVARRIAEDSPCPPEVNDLLQKVITRLQEQITALSETG